MMRMSLCSLISEEQKFDDEANWELEEEATQESKIKEGNSYGGDQLPMAHIWDESLLSTTAKILRLHVNANKWQK